LLQQKKIREAIDHLFSSVQFPVLPRQLPPLLERLQVMAWSLRFEPGSILIQAKAGNQKFVRIGRSAVARVAFSAYSA
jgi:hypothetical protein